MLACPMDKYHPLELYVIREIVDNESICNETSNDNTCKDNTRKDNGIVSEGALYCTKCSRFYPIIEEIPIMLPDDLRDKKHEMDFLAKYKESLPDKITAHANPWHL